MPGSQYPRRWHGQPRETRASWWSPVTQSSKRTFFRSLGWFSRRRVSLFWVPIQPAGLNIILRHPPSHDLPGCTYIHLIPRARLGSDATQSPLRGKPAQPLGSSAASIRAPSPSAEGKRRTVLCPKDNAHTGRLESIPFLLKQAQNISFKRLYLI